MKTNRTKSIHINSLEIMTFMNGLVFYAPVALLVRTGAGLLLDQFFVLQAVLSAVIFILEIPTGKLTDRIGYKTTLVLSELSLLAARILLLTAFLSRSYVLFLLEAFVEGVSACFSSGTVSAYLYRQYNEKEYVVKSARIGNFGTAGFIISTVTYAAIYHIYGIKGLLISTVISSLVGVLSGFGIEKERQAALSQSKSDTKIKRELGITPRNILIVVILAGISISFILINFFYVDKLQVLGISEEWMSAIILGYSAIGMLAERLLYRIDENRYLLTFLIGFAAAGVMMIIFGITGNVFIAIPIMLLLPLSIMLPAYIFDAIENQVIDEYGLGHCRAEVLSIFNMGVNLMEVIFLFGSALISRAGISISFVLTGLVLGILGIAGYLAFGRDYARII